MGARCGGAGGEKKVGRGRGGGEWGRKGRAGPARPRPRALARALSSARSRAAAGAVVSRLWSGRLRPPRPGSPLPTLAAAGQTLRAGTSAASPSRRRAPGRAAPPPGSAAAAPRTNQNRRLAPYSSARPAPGTAAPASPRGGAPAAPRPPCRPRARCGAGESAPGRSCPAARWTQAGLPPAPGSGCRPPRREALQPWAELPWRRWRLGTLCMARRLLSLRPALLFPGAPEKDTGSGQLPELVSKSHFQRRVCSLPAGHCSEQPGPPPGHLPGRKGCPLPSLLLLLVMWDLGSKGT